MMLTTSITVSYVILFCGVLIFVPQIIAAPYIDQEIDQSKLTSSSITDSRTTSSYTTSSSSTSSSSTTSSTTDSSTTSSSTIDSSTIASSSTTSSTTISQSCLDEIIDGEVYKFYWDEEEKRCHTCPKCTVGFEPNKHCGNGEGAGVECVECGPETFSPDNGYDKCEPCAICESVVDNLKECTPKTDRICGPCKLGYAKDSYGNCELCDNFPPGSEIDCEPPPTCGPDSFLTEYGKCEPCAICENVVDNEQECTPTTDRICGRCKPGYAEDINGNCELCANFPPGVQSDCEQTTIATTTKLLTTTEQITTHAKTIPKSTINPTTEIISETHQITKNEDKHDRSLKTGDTPSKSPHGSPYSHENKHEDLEVSPVSQRGQVWQMKVFVFIATSFAISFMGWAVLFSCFIKRRHTIPQLLTSIRGSKSMSFEDEKTPEDKNSNPGSNEEKEEIKVNVEKQTATFIKIEDVDEDIKLKAENAPLHDDNKRDRSVAEAKVDVNERNSKDGQEKKQRGGVASLLRVSAQIKRTMSRESASDSGNEEQRLIPDSVSELDNDVFVEHSDGELTVPTDLSASPESPTTLSRNTPNIHETSISASPESPTTLTRNTPNIPVSLKEAGVNGYEGETDKDRNNDQQIEWQRKFDRALELSEGKPITDILDDETAKYDLVSMLTPPAYDSTTTTQPIKYYTNMLSGIGVEYKHRNRHKGPEDVLNYMHKSMAGSRDMKRLLEEVHKIDRLDITDHVIDFILKKYEKNEK